MKLTYQFMQDLLNLLRIEDWTLDLTQRIENVNMELEELNTKTQKSIIAKQNRWKELEDQGKNFPTIEQQENIINSINQKEKAELIGKKENLELSLNEGKYNLGVGVFENVENAQLLLQHIDFLCSKDLGFNLYSVRAIESMIKENFPRLNNKEVDRKILRTSAIINDFSMVEEFLSGQINNSEDVQNFQIKAYYSFPGSEIPECLEKESIVIYNMLKILDKELVAYSYQKLKPFIMWFQFDIRYGAWDNIILNLPSYFSSKEAIDNYLENEVNFESFQTIENTIMLSNLNKIFELNNQERSIWQNLNAQFGKKSMRLFGQSVDIKNKGFNIVEVANNEETLSDLFSKVKSCIETIRFGREDGHEDLAKILRKYDIEEESFNKILDEVLPNIQNANSLPDVTITTKDGKYTLKKLPSNDYRGFVLGKMTNCCQYIGGDSERCVIDGFTRETAGFYILTDNKNENIKAQSYAWIGRNNQGKDVLILDSFEHLPEATKYFVELIQELSDKIKENGFDDLYIGTGGKTPQLNADRAEISPKDPDLYVYYDSKLLYKITNDTDTIYNDESHAVRFKTFDDITSNEYYKLLSDIQSMDPEKSASFNRQSMVIIKANIEPITNALSNNLITSEQIVRLFSVSDPFSKMDWYVYLDNFNIIFKKALESIVKISNFSEFKDWYTTLLKKSEKSADATSKSYKIMSTLGMSYDPDDKKSEEEHRNIHYKLQQEILDGKISQNMQDVCNEPNITNLIGQYLYGEWYGND